MDLHQQTSGTVALVEANSCPLGVQLVSSQKTNKPSSPQDLVQLAMAVQKADEFTKANAGSKLTVIADQIRYLQEQARKVLEDSRRDAALHHAACNMVKKPGTMYYLYERDSGQPYLSILSPQEWGAACPHTFLGGYRLEYDQSWTPIDKVPQRDQDNAAIDKIFHAQQAIAAASSTTELLGLNRKDNSSKFAQILDSGSSETTSDADKS